METFAFDSNEKIHLFKELLTCDSTIFSWTYDAAGELLDTNCEHLALDKIFSATGCKEYMVNYARTMTAPLLLSAPLGIMWCAVIQRIDGALLRLHVIGVQHRDSFHRYPESCGPVQYPSLLAFRLYPPAPNSAGNIKHTLFSVRHHAPLLCNR